MTTDENQPNQENEAPEQAGPAANENGQEQTEETEDVTNETQAPEAPAGVSPEAPVNTPAVDAAATDADAAELPTADAAAAGEGSETGEEAEINPILAEPTNPNFRWYVVHTYSMYEEKAKIALFERVERFGMEAKFGEVFVPKTQTERVLKSGKKKKVEQTSFPGYILVQMEMSDETNHIVRDTPKITGFVGNARNPRPVTDKEVLRLTAPETLKEESKVEASTLNFEKGETVKVIDGAFTNFDGVVEAVQADKMKLRILVSIFGRETPVELDYGQVQKLD